MRRTAGYTGLVLGLLLIVTAGLIRWVVAPNKTVLPGNTDTTRTYAGTAAVLFNPAALTGTGGQVLAHGVPITVVHHTKVLGTSGNNALVSDARSVSAGGQPVAAVDYRYAVNRKSLGAGSGFSNVIAQTGLTFNWPINTQKRDYTGWVSDTHQATTLRYTGTANRGGVSVYTYTATTKPAQIVDPQVLKGLPQSLPKATLVQLATQLGLPAAQLQGLQALLPSLPDPVPFSYTYQVSAQYWVAPASGIVVDVKQHEVRALGLSVGGVTTAVTPVLDMTFTSTPATLTAAAKDANNKADAITLIHTTLPLGALIAGTVALLGGAVLLGYGRRRGPNSPPPGATHGTRVPVSTPAA